MFFAPKEPPIILSIGGSLIVPTEKADSEFLKDLNDFVREYVKRGKQFFLVAGGGKTARHYRDAGQEVIGDVTEEDLDWLGIHATHLNGHLLRTIFKDIAHPRIIQNYDKKLNNWKEPVVIGAGWKPGWSTDYDAVILARDYGANLIINLSNIDWVFDKDPSKFKDAKPIKKMTWEEMEKLVGTEWSPGINAPFDPVASQLAKRLNLTVVVANGKNFSNLHNILDGESFKGTVIMPYRIDAGFYDREYYKGKKSGRKIGSGTSFFASILNKIVSWYRALTIKIFINPKNCLDVGCGTGDLIKSLRSFGIEAHGIELSKDAIDLVDDDIRQYVKIGDITKIPFTDNEFELVVTFDVLEHIEQSKIRKAVDELIRVSKKMILNKIYTKENHYLATFHRRDYSQVSVFNKKFWQKLFSENEKVTVMRSNFFRLPQSIETIFILKKK